jgi:hypothetical protein
MLSIFWRYQVKLPSLKLKTRPKQILGSLPLVIALPATTYCAEKGPYSVEKGHYLSRNAS